MTDRYSVLIVTRKDNSKLAKNDQKREKAERNKANAAKYKKKTSNKFRGNR